MFGFLIRMQIAMLNLVPDRHDDQGQSTAEYALVLLGAAAIAVLVISWATSTNLVGKLFDFVLGKVMGSAG